jgi:hypothetical protein
MSLSIDPPALQVPASGGVSTHQLSNPGESRLAFKVKSTNNDHYRLKPVFGFVEPGQTASVEVTRIVIFSLFCLVLFTLIFYLV